MDRKLERRRWSSAFGARGGTVFLACVGVALALGLVAPSAAGPAPSFAKARNYAAGYVPATVAIGDLNGDGKPDLVTSSGNGDTVSVLLKATAASGPSATTQSDTAFSRSRSAT